MKEPLYRKIRIVYISNETKNRYRRKLLAIMRREFLSRQKLQQLLGISNKTMYQILSEREHIWSIKTVKAVTTFLAARIKAKQDDTTSNSQSSDSTL